MEAAGWKPRFTSQQPIRLPVPQHHEPSAQWVIIEKLLAVPPSCAGIGVSVQFDLIYVFL
jgi:hypothetical protein